MWLQLIVRFNAVCSDPPHHATQFLSNWLITTSWGLGIISTNRSWPIKFQRPVGWYWRKCWGATCLMPPLPDRLETCGSLSPSHWAANWPQSWTWSATWCWRSGVGNGAVAWYLCWECEAPQLHRIFAGLRTRLCLLIARPELTIVHGIMLYTIPRAPQAKVPPGASLTKVPRRHIHHLPKRDTKNERSPVMVWWLFRQWTGEISTAKSSHENVRTRIRIIFFLN